MTTQSSPVLARRRLARKLRGMRERNGMTLTEAAPRLYKTKSALNRVENGESSADPHLVQSMMDLYDEYDPELLTLAIAARRPGWWVAYGVKDQGYIGLETEAVTCDELSLMYVPGLLQTEAYMRAVLTHVKPKSPSRLMNDVAARMVRKGRLTDPEEPLQLTAVIDETALRKRIGGAETMRDQLRHLIEAAELDTVTLQVLPDSLGPHEGMDGAFIVLEFQDPEDPAVLYMSNVIGALHVEKPRQVREAKLTFDRLRSVALSPADSVPFIERLGAGLYDL